MSSSDRVSRELTPPPLCFVWLVTVVNVRRYIMPRSGRYKRSAPITSAASSIIAAGGYGKAESGRAWVAFSLSAGGWVPAWLVSEYEQQQEKERRQQ